MDVPPCARGPGSDRGPHRLRGWVSRVAAAASPLTCLLSILSIHPSIPSTSLSQRYPLTPGDADGSEAEFEEERITLFTADGLVSIPGRRRRRREAAAAAATPQPPPHATLPPSWDLSPPSPSLLAWAASLQSKDDALFLPSWSEGGLCLASPFQCRAASTGDSTRAVLLHGWTRCPASLTHTVSAVAASLRGAVLEEFPLPPPPGGLAPPGTTISLALPLLHGVPPALDALVAAIAGAPGGRHVIERVTREWVVLPGRRRR